MIHGISEYEKFKVVRPIIGECEYDAFQIPIMKKTTFNELDWENLNAIGFQNASPRTSDKNTLVMMFNFDNRLLSLWNNPLKKIGLFQGYAAVSTPDYSITPEMNINMVRHYIFMSRWLGVTWQNYGCKVLPTAIWALPDTYDICFGSIEYGSIVLVSTIGCQSNVDVFLNGFNEMKRRINPPLIIVFGDMINSMAGTFLNFRYNETFYGKSKYKQMRLEGFTNIFEIKEEM